MAATGYSPIQLYYSTTASAAPTAGNLASGELAINITDGKLYYKDNAGAVQLLSTSTTANGTANGVLYLNASKVATAGSALVFDGTNFAIGLATPDARLNVNGYTGNGTLRIGGAATGESVLYFANAASGTGSYAGYLQYLHSSNAMVFGAASAERMRLTSTGLGIGTSSPGAKLGIDAAGTSGYWERFYNSGTELAYWYFDANTLQLSSKSATRALTFLTNDIERMRLDSSGNLGLGVTPSAWSSDHKALQIGAGGAFWSQVSQSATFVSANTRFDGANFRYLNSAAASYYGTYSGAHQWFTAASGTAGATTTFTQAMTLDASGNLGVGTTSPATRMHISGGPLRVDDTNIMFLNPNYASGVMAVQGFSNAALAFCTNNTERARIDSSGNLLVGTTSLGGAGGLGISPNSTNGAAAMFFNRTAASTTSYVVDFRNGGSTVGYIAYNNTLVTYATASDYRLKDNQQPLTGSGAFIDALQPKTWNWKADGSRGVGFIAHEVQEVSPGSVVGEKDGEQMQAMEYGSAEFIANIIAELQSLRKRLADAGIA